MNYAAIKTFDVANAPGIRVSLFVSGCNHRCPGCIKVERPSPIVHRSTKYGRKSYSDFACKNNIAEFFELLDVGFFKARYERCAESDKKFVFAMVKCDTLPCTISNVAKNLHKSVGSISTTRAQLINKGIIYPVRYKELDFTVPEFTGYIQRLDEYKQWCEEN